MKAKTNAQESICTSPDTQPLAELTTMRLGKLRLDIKRHLAEEMRQIDELVEKLIA